MELNIIYNISKTILSIYNTYMINEEIELEEDKKDYKSLFFIIE